MQPDARTLYIPEHLHNVVYTSVCSKPLFKHGVTIDDVLYSKKTKLCRYSKIKQAYKRNLFCVGVYFALGAIRIENNLPRLMRPTLESYIS